MPDLAVKLSADTAEFESDMGRAAHVSEREMEGMIAKATAAGQLIGNAISKIAGHFASLVGETIKAGDELSKLSARTGQTVERLSELQFAAKLSDVGFGELATGLGFFNKALAEAQNENSKTGQTFKALGVDISAGPQRAMEQFIKAIDGLPNAETKTAAMRIAFGRAGDALIPMIGNLDEVSQRARNLGIVMTEDLAEKSKRFNEALITLNASSRALAITFLTPLMETLTRAGEGLVKSKEQGTTFKDVVIEIGKGVIATHGSILSYIPLWGGYLEKAAQSAFNALDRMKQASPISGKIGGPPDAEMGPPRSLANPDAVACAVSGGKWVNGACQREKPRAGRKAPDDSERVAREMARGEEELAKEVAEAWSFVPKMTERLQEWDQLVNAWGEDTFMGMSLEDAREWVKLQFQGIDALDEITDRTARVAAGFTEEGKAIEETKNKTNEWGHAISTAFEDAIVNGKKFGDVMTSLAKTIAQIVLRMTVTKPLENALDSALNGGGGFSGIINRLFGGGSTAGAAATDANIQGLDISLPSFDVGTDYVPRDMIAKVHQGERIVPAGQNTGGGVSINNHYNIDSRSDRGDIVAAIKQSERRTLAQVADMTRRGGGYSRAVRG